MYAYKDLHSLLDVSINWEKELKDLYDVAELGVKNEKSRELISFLLSKQTKILNVLKNIDINKYGQDEFVKFTPENHTEDLIPNHEISKNSEPDEIIALIKKYEAKLKDFYREIADHLVTENQKELFTSLVVLKEAQLEAIENYMKQHFDTVNS